ncbi:MAG: biotin--[acetyl-CoA-carboxylase] ligase [Dysgonomonas sp.]|nr:biotin--[acetyl-CoA-carboxylase] ligase [Dysgonomonas sp.]
MEIHSFVHIQETDSTSQYIRKLVSERDTKKSFTVYADFQTSGRGQRGNSWESERGKNLLFSTVLFPKSLEASEQFLLSQIISLAIKDVLDKETSDITIKWPNDIYWKNKKITGILIENDIMDGNIYQSILGVGININQEKFESDAPNPISLKQITGKEYDIKDILQRIINCLSSYHNLINSQENITSIRKQYKESLFRKEGKHLFEDKNGQFYARIIDVEPSGLLVLETEKGDINKYAFKEVKYIL